MSICIHSFRRLAQRLPTRYLLALQWPFYAVQDVLHPVKPAPNGWPVPPRRLAFVYGFDPDFSHVGHTFLGYLRDLCGLQPSHSVLEVGCGVGRCALALMDYLSDAGVYHGFDIRRQAVRWCDRQLHASRTNFHFHHADLRNPAYRSGGRASASGFVFPHEDHRFDLVFSKSVFTHMRRADIARYLLECRRVLKPGGVCLHTFFILNPVSRAGQTRSGTRFHFRFPLDDGTAWSINRREPEHAIAYDETQVRALFDAAGLAICEPIRYGAWSGRPDGLSGQDIVISRSS